jgi:sec-independent protein translocase protein TatA
MGTGLVTPWHLAIVLVVALLVFGPKRLPEMGRSLGKGMREFKDSLSGEDREHADAPVTQQQAQLPPAAPPPSATTPPAPADRDQAGTPR